MRARDARDAMARISNELRGAQPHGCCPRPRLALPQPPITSAGPMEVRFYSSFNSLRTRECRRQRIHGVAADSHLAGHRHGAVCAVEPKGQDAVLAAGSQQQRVLHGRERQVPSCWPRTLSTASLPTRPTSARQRLATSYTASSGTRTALQPAATILWTDNESPNTVMASLSYIVAVRVRVIVDTNSPVRRTRPTSRPRCACATRAAIRRKSDAQAHEPERDSRLILLIGIMAALAILAATLVFVIANQQRATASVRRSESVSGRDRGRARLRRHRWRS